MTIRICDICGDKKAKPASTINFSIGVWRGEQVSIALTASSISSLGPKRVLDLCPACTIELLNHMRDRLVVTWGNCLGAEGEGAE